VNPLNIEDHDYGYLLCSPALRRLAWTRYITILSLLRYFPWEIVRKIVAYNFEISTGKRIRKERNELVWSVIKDPVPTKRSAREYSMVNYLPRKHVKRGRQTSFVHQEFRFSCIRDVRNFQHGCCRREVCTCQE